MLDSILPAISVVFISRETSEVEDDAGKSAPHLTLTANDQLFILSALRYKLWLDKYLVNKGKTYGSTGTPH
ncbi:MAG: hypothetical protein HRU19_27885 [Pseudobacteriovorax sp.]|nr:hypothetical protein [Pseudobacteriovorax sp.]